MEKENIEIGKIYDILVLDDIQIFRSVGARAKNYDIFDVSTGSIFHIIEGTKIQNVQVFAGYGVRKQLNQDVAIGLSEQEGGTPSK